MTEKPPRRRQKLHLIVEKLTERVGPQVSCSQISDGHSKRRDVKHACLTPTSASPSITDELRAGGDENDIPQVVVRLPFTEKNARLSLPDYQLSPLAKLYVSGIKETSYTEQNDQETDTASEGEEDSSEEIMINVEDTDSAPECEIEKGKQHSKKLRCDVPQLPKIHRTVPCKFCDKKFYWQVHLRFHVERKHADKETAGKSLNVNDESDSQDLQVDDIPQLERNSDSEQMVNNNHADDTNSNSEEKFEQIVNNTPDNESKSNSGQTSEQLTNNTVTEGRYEDSRQNSEECVNRSIYKDKDLNSDNSERSIDNRLPEERKSKSEQKSEQLTNNRICEVNSSDSEKLVCSRLLEDSDSPPEQLNNLGPQNNQNTNRENEVLNGNGSNGGNGGDGDETQTTDTSLDSQQVTDDAQKAMNELLNYCDHCNRTFYIRELLRQHIKTVVKNLEGKIRIIQELTEPQTREFRCKECGELFPKEDKLNAHVLKHPNYKAFECHICHSCYETLACLRRHATVHTTKQRKGRYACAYCGKIMAKPSALKEHEALHSGPRPHRCRSCKRGFTTAEKLEEHELFHLGLKEYKCTLCDKGFPNLSALKGHKLYVHGEKRFKCEVCDKSFKREDHLRVHSRIHSEDKPFKCDTCGKQFNQKVCLTLHLPCREEERRQKREEARKRREEKLAKKGPTTSTSSSRKRRRKFNRNGRSAAIKAAASKLSENEDETTKGSQNEVELSDAKDVIRTPEHGKIKKSECSEENQTTEVIADRTRKKAIDKSIDSTVTEQTSNGGDLGNQETKQNQVSRNTRKRPKRGSQLTPTRTPKRAKQNLEKQSARELDNQSEDKEDVPEEPCKGASDIRGSSVENKGIVEGPGKESYGTAVMRQIGEGASAAIHGIRIARVSCKEAQLESVAVDQIGISNRSQLHTNGANKRSSVHVLNRDNGITQASSNITGSKGYVSSGSILPLRSPVCKEWRGATTTNNYLKSSYPDQGSYDPNAQGPLPVGVHPSNSYGAQGLFHTNGQGLLSTRAHLTCTSSYATQGAFNPCAQGSLSIGPHTGSSSGHSEQKGAHPPRSISYSVQGSYNPCVQGPNLPSNYRYPTHSSYASYAHENHSSSSMLQEMPNHGPCLFPSRDSNTQYSWSQGRSGRNLSNSGFASTMSSGDNRNHMIDRQYVGEYPNDISSAIISAINSDSTDFVDQANMFYSNR
ncbi:uncharacterized protein LOC116620253 [Nematostella vectensis]|nr:uncharacterized protein LOC116620253 [Nematostella vectensis]